MNSDKKEIIVIGGGPAGMMAAIAASQAGAYVSLLEQNEKLGKKLFITGKGRCNITNACAGEEILSHVVTNPKFLYSAFRRFSNQDMIAFLEKEGLKTKVERGGRVFPVSDHSSDVIKVLRSACLENGVKIRCNTRVSQVETSSGRSVDNESAGSGSERQLHFSSVLLEDGTRLWADAVIIATGGFSYQSTGSTGDGYTFAKSLGHRVKEPAPSLVPFEIQETWCGDLMGLSLKNIAIQIKNGKKKVYEGFGEFLFTHFGVSGPLVLTASTRLGKGSLSQAMEEGRLMLYLDLKPALDRETLEKRFLREFDIWRNKNISNVISQMLPTRMVPVFLDLCEIPVDKKVRDITKQERRRMEETMKALPLHIKGVRGFDEAIITRGGVYTKEVDPGTMESKLVKGVYFAGELLDVDAETGGYNLQIAWSTGYTAGINAAKSLNA